MRSHALQVRHGTILAPVPGAVSYQEVLQSLFGEASLEGGSSPFHLRSLCSGTGLI